MSRKLSHPVVLCNFLKHHVNKSSAESKTLGNSEKKSNLPKIGIDTPKRNKQIDLNKFPILAIKNRCGCFSQYTHKATLGPVGPPADKDL